MPFGLKNLGTMYQRMVNQVFKDLLGNTIETYIDDMIIKSDKTGSHAKKLARVLEVLIEYNMILNLNYLLGVLRYMIT